MSLKELFKNILGKKEEKKAGRAAAIKEYKIDKDFIEARIEVKDLSNFLQAFMAFMQSPEIKKLIKCPNVEIVLEASTNIRVRSKDGYEGTGFVNNLKIVCGGQFIGIIIAKFFDRRLFLTSPRLRRTVKKEETPFLKMSWMVPIEPITVFLKPEFVPKFAEKFWQFVEFYRDDYPNPLAARFAPLLSEVKK